MKTLEPPYSLQELLLVLWRKKWLILLITILGIVLGYVISTQMKPKYEATTEILIETDKSDNLLYTQNMMETYREVLTSSALIKKVNEQGNFDLTTNEYNEQVKITMINTSQLITITAKADNELEPVKLVNKIATVFKKELTNYSKINTALVLNPATQSISNQDSTFNELVSILIGGVIGLLLAICYCLLREIYSTKVDTETNVQRLNVPLLAKVTKKDSAQQWLYHIAALIQGEVKLGKKTVLLLNSAKEESGYLQQLSQLLAQHKQVVVLKQIEGNAHFVKTNEGEPDAFIYSTATPFSALQQKYNELEQQYDIVLVETSQLDSAETMLVASNQTQFIYCVDAKKTTLKQAKSILKKIVQLKMHRLGIVIAK
ncbi:MAG TPA: hypothetical protein H9983_03770 [Candidatus Kurthia intestinigallinarum]|nr:hypothetical protein [Candidatus Kurthia intestinigallinarum]